MKDRVDVKKLAGHRGKTESEHTEKNVMSQHLFTQDLWQKKAKKTIQCLKNHWLRVSSIDKSTNPQAQKEKTYQGTKVCPQLTHLHRTVMMKTMLAVRTADMEGTTTVQASHFTTTTGATDRKNTLPVAKGGGKGPLEMF